MSYMRFASDKGCRELWDLQDKRAKKENKYYISAFSKFRPRNLRISNNYGKTYTYNNYTFPSFSYLRDTPIQYRDRETLTDGEMVEASFYHARRIRNYLASAFLHRMPIVWRVFGKDFTFANDFGGEKEEFLLPYDLDPVIGKTQDDVNSGFKLRYYNTIKLLNAIVPGTLLDKCLNLYGSAIWTEDLLDAYNYRWRVIELIANREVKRIKQETINDYLSAKVKDIKCPCLKKREMRLGSRDKIIISFRELFPEIPLDFDGLKKWNALRDNISHGDITIDTYKREFEYYRGISNLSREYLQAELKKEFKTEETFIM